MFVDLVLFQRDWIPRRDVRSAWKRSFLERVRLQGYCILSAGRRHDGGDALLAVERVAVVREEEVRATACRTEWIVSDYDGALGI